MQITGKQALGIIRGSSEFKLVANEIEDVDDHGDATHYVVFQIADGRYFQFSYIKEKEWGAMISKDDEIDCDEVRPVEKTIVVYEKVPTT